MDEQRAEFEVWAKQAGWPHHATMPINKGPDYFSDMSLAVWQAATQRQQERIAYVEKIAEDAIELCTQQANRVMELEAQVQALSLDAGRLRTSQSRTGFMCLTDFQHELGEASGGISVYADEDDLKKHRNCWKGCGILKVEVVAAIARATHKEGA